MTKSIKRYRLSLSISLLSSPTKAGSASSGARASRFAGNARSEAEGNSVILGLSETSCVPRLSFSWHMLNNEIDVPKRSKPEDIRGKFRGSLQGSLLGRFKCKGVWLEGVTRLTKSG